MSATINSTIITVGNELDGFHTVEDRTQQINSTIITVGNELDGFHTVEDRTQQINSTIITVGNELDGFHTVEDRTQHQIKIPFHSLHLTFTRSADTVVIQQLGNCTVAVERLGETDAIRTILTRNESCTISDDAIRTILTRNESCTISDNASVFYCCKECDDGSLYIDREDVIMLHYGPFSFGPFSDYLESKGMDRNVALGISAGLGLREKRQLCFVSEQVIEDIKDDCFDGLKVSDENLDLLRKICKEWRQEHWNAK